MKCRRPNCPKKAKRRGYCVAHYERVPHGLVDATECRAHVRALRDIGYSLNVLSEITGLDCDTLASLGTWTPKSRVEVNTHLRIMAVPMPDGLVDCGSQTVPNVGTRRRLQALHRAGYSREHLGAELGVTSQAVGFWLKNEVVYSGTAVRVRDLFKRLQLTPGPSKRAAAYAQRQGWAPPFAWDEDGIDDPGHRPHMARNSEGLSGWYENYLELKEFGLTNDQIAERQGIHRDSLYKRLERHRRKSVTP